MHSKLLAVILTLFCFSQVIAQKTKYETFSLKKYKKPTIQNLENANSTICFILINKTKLKDVKNFYGLTESADFAHYYNKNFSYKTMKVSLSYPNYTSEIHFNPNNKIIASYKKTQSSELGPLNTFRYTTNLSAVQYITDLKTKKTYKRDIILKQSKKLNEKEFFTTPKYQIGKEIMNIDVTYNAALTVPNVNNINLKTYLKNGKAVVKNVYSSKIYQEQVKRILLNGDAFIKKAFYKQPYYEKLSFFYIKKYKGHNIKPFNTAFDNVKTFFNSKTKDTTLLHQASSFWKGEIGKLNVNDKKEKKLFLKGIQNIVNVYYILKNQDSVKKYVLEGRKYNSKPNYLEAFLNPNNKSDSKQNKNLALLKSIPEKLFMTNKFLKKSINKINPIPSFTSKDITWITNMFLVKDLASQKSTSEYVKNNIFYAFSKIYVEKFLKKNYPEVSESLKKYSKEAKKLRVKPNGVNEFYKNNSISDIDKNITYESLNAYFNDNFKKINPEYKDLIRSIIALNSAIYILKNNNGKTEQYSTALRNFRLKFKKYANTLPEPKPEIIEELTNNIPLIQNPVQIMALNYKDITNLSYNLMKLASKLYPY